MSDEKPWLDGDGPESVTALLAAARAEEPRGPAIGRTLAALGVGGAAVTAATHATGATLGSAAVGSATKGAAGASSLLFVLKWGAVGAVAAAATVVTGHVVVDSVAPSPPTKASVASPVPVPAHGVGVAEVPAAPAPEPPVTEPDSLPAPRVVRSAAAVEPPTPPSEQAESLERMSKEVAAIDQARALLGRGNAKASLAALDSYSADFPARRFEPESLYIRMEAERALGDQAAARRAAERLLTAFPNAPQAARARVLLGR